MFCKESLPVLRKYNNANISQDVGKYRRFQVQMIFEIKLLFWLSGVPRVISVRQQLGFILDGITTFANTSRRTIGIVGIQFPNEIHFHFKRRILATLRSVFNVSKKTHHKLLMYCFIMCWLKKSRFRHYKMLPVKINIFTGWG